MINPDRIREARRLAEGMATGDYVSDVSPYHAELLTELLDDLERLHTAALHYCDMAPPRGHADESVRLEQLRDACGWPAFAVKR